MFIYSGKQLIVIAFGLRETECINQLIIKSVGDRIKRLPLTHNLKKLFSLSNSYNGHFITLVILLLSNESSYLLSKILGTG